MPRLCVLTGVVISRRGDVSAYCGGSGLQVRDKFSSKGASTAQMALTHAMSKLSHTTSSPLPLELDLRATHDLMQRTLTSTRSISFFAVGVVFARFHLQLTCIMISSDPVTVDSRERFPRTLPSI
jgi:hypothetical protein